MDSGCQIINFIKIFCCILCLMLTVLPVVDVCLVLVDYSCAMQKDILVHGRLYITQNWVCFYANIFRWETIVSSALYMHSYNIHTPSYTHHAYTTHHHTLILAYTIIHSSCIHHHTHHTYMCFKVYNMCEGCLLRPSVVGRGAY